MILYQSKDGKRTLTVEKTTKKEKIEFVLTVLVIAGIVSWLKN